MLRAVLSDLHVGQADGDIERFVATIERLAAMGVGELTLLGDLFRILIGYPKYWDETVRRGLDALVAFRRSGSRVVMLEGNRDFFLGSHYLDACRDSDGTAHSFSVGGRRFLLEHGDLINRRDRAYRFWRAISKGGPARLWARLLPGSLARRIVRGTEARLAETNFSYRQTLPVEDLSRAARRHFANGVDVVLWGHFHRPWRLAHDGREARVVPAWCESGTILYVEPDGIIRVEARQGSFVDSGSEFVVPTAEGPRGR
jgi:UDP-2,3-diacylglucosamine hydrolase